MSEITWTATRNVQPGDAEVFARLVEATAVDDTHILGGCRGGDALLARLLSARGAMVHVVLPADRSQIDPEWQLFCSSFEEMPGAPRSASVMSEWSSWEGARSVSRRSPRSGSPTAERG